MNDINIGRCCNGNKNEQNKKINQNAHKQQTSIFTHFAPIHFDFVVGWNNDSLWIIDASFHRLIILENLYVCVN